MELQHVNIKVFVDGELNVDSERFIEVFHRWTSEQPLPELLIDVADYRHVPSGPGVVLVGHEADYAMDHGDDRWGLLYNRKAAVSGGNVDRLTQAFHAACDACRRLEDELQAEGPLRFSRQEFQLLINDRALAPNTPETLAACRADIDRFLNQVFGDGDFTIQQESEPRRRFSLTITSAAPYELAART